MGKKSAAALIVVALVFGCGWLWFGHLTAPPDVAIPTPTMPKPNAFDYFVTAGNTVIDGDKVAYAGSPWHFLKDRNDHPYTLPQCEALVRENAGALRTLRQGMKYSYLSPPGRSINDRFPYWGRDRGLARLLRLQGQVKAMRGDWGGAVQSDLDAVQMGEQIPHGAVIIGALVGIACQAVGRDDVWLAIAHLSAAQARAAAGRLEQIQSGQEPFAETLQQEKWMGQAAMLEQFRQGKLFGELPHIAQNIVLRRYTGYMNQCIANARLPYATKPPAPPIPNDPINAIFCPMSTVPHIRATENQTQNALLMTALALRAYRLEHGAYPATLNALVPGYLCRVPDDPFALSSPLHYKLKGAKYVLYSIGPDGRDDGGRPIFDASKPAPTPGEHHDPRYYTQEDSTGDIVAGVNPI